MKAAVCTAYGPPEVVQLRETHKPRPGRNDVLIRVHAAALTTSDTRIRGLQYPRRLQALLRIVVGLRAPRAALGLVLSGQVESVGSNVSKFKPGDEIFGFDSRFKFGAHAEYACWPANDLLVRKPEGLSHVEAAAIPYGGLMAMFFMRRAGVKRGQRVAVFGASGANGTSMVQLAAHVGATVTGICSGRNCELVRSLGAATCVDYTVDDFTKMDALFDVVLDAVGGLKNPPSRAAVAKILAPGGVYVSVDETMPRLTQADLEQLARLASEGSLKPVIDRTYPLEQIADAHAYVDRGHKRGNVIVTVTAR
jgi:NADPH:quinone reductase-like Zn-dependent oxidoreductase